MFPKKDTLPKVLSLATDFLVLFCFHGIIFTDAINYGDPQCDFLKKSILNPAVLE